jgi:NAD(P)H-hydrate epimerase
MKKLTIAVIKKIFKAREVSSHKGDHGHALIVAGNIGRMGAAVIASRACLRSGAGLLTVNTPAEQAFILQVAIPEAMYIVRHKTEDDLTKFSAAGIGPGLGVGKDEAKLLAYLLAHFNKPMLLDADALNIIAAHKKLLAAIPAGTVLTPHPKEFDRLFGNHTTTEERVATAIKKAAEYNVVIVLKGHETLVTFKGASFINTTGNAGLAKAGSGDALTGIITGFLAQGYNSFDAAKLGVFIHGLSADFALQQQSLESMLITDAIECIGNAFKHIDT